MFCHLEKKVVSPSCSLLNAFLLSPKIDMEDVLNCQDPPNFDWISTKDPDQGCVMMEFAAPMPPNTHKVKAYASKESTISDYYRFGQAVLSLPPMEGVNVDFDWAIE